MSSTDFWHVVRDSVWKIVWVTLFTYRSAKILSKKNFLGVGSMALDVPEVNNQYQINFSKSI